MITISTTIYDRTGTTPIGRIARQGCLWGAFRPDQPDAFFYATSQRDVIEAIRADHAERHLFDALP